MPLTRSLLNFVKVTGVQPRERYAPYAEWAQARREAKAWPYRRILTGPPSDCVDVLDEKGDRLFTECINYASQDYLGLGTDVRIHEAAKEAIDRFGIHSSGSPVLLGRHELMVMLEEQLCERFQRDRCVLYPTGWAAGFGVVAGLVRPTDTVLMDKLAHNCLQVGAQVTAHVHRFRHNDVGELEDLLRKARERSASSGVFILIESLYSMDADSPDLPQVLSLARRYDAIVILDVAHDFGAMGEHGLGLLEQVAPSSYPDVIMGSFSKTFASNGGFVMCSPAVHEYLCYHSPPHIFSNALSPVQAATITQALDIIFSEEGHALRKRLLSNVLSLRKELEHHGIEVGGVPSPIVPAFVGDEALARITSGLLAEKGLLANLVEFPAVARGTARFRFQAMPQHGTDTAHRAAQILAAAVQQAHQALNAPDSNPT